MKVGILGLGLIGGSLARAYALEGHTVYAAETNESMLSFAMLAGAVHGKLDEETIPQCDLILLAIYPDGSASWLEQNAPFISKDALVMDCCGVKQEVCRRCFPVAKEYGFTFVGGHPMAGSQFSGFKYSRATLYNGAPMVLVPPVFDDIALLQRVFTAGAAYDGPMPGKSAVECGNYLEHDLPGARRAAAAMAAVLQSWTPARLAYENNR